MGAAFGAALATLAGLSPGVSALPSGAQVTQGSATLQQQGSTLTVTTGNGTVINWQRFGIAEGETVRFAQPSSASQVLNRVVGGEPSQILGNLVSNGRVFLINPSGVAFGRGAQVDVAALVVSTLRLSDADFAAGRLDFGGDGRAAAAGAIRNEGRIRTPAGGMVYLVAPQVDNSGLIHSPEGEVLLAAGHRVTIVNPRHPEVSWEVTAPPAQVLNLGEIVARRISMVGTDVGNAGTIRATTAVRGEDGRIVLRAARAVGQAPGGRLEAQGVAADGAPRGGEIDIQAADKAVLGGAIAVLPSAAGQETALPDGATEAEAPRSAPVFGSSLQSAAAPAGGALGVGGRVRVFARDIALQDGLALDASGPSGGGVVLVGGGPQGAWAGADPSRALRMAATASIRADATDAGDGGTVILWSEGATSAHGAISARGGPRSGNGGFIETSGRLWLDVSRPADAGAPAGRPGQWLLDPADIEIVARNGSLDGVGQPYTPPDGAQGSTISAAVITSALNQGTDVRVSTGAAAVPGSNSPVGRITVNAPIVMNAAAGSTRASLHLQAASSVVVNEDIRSESGTLDLLLEPNFGGGVGGTVTIGAERIDLKGGRLTFLGADPVPVSLARPNGAQTLANLSLAGPFEALQQLDLTLQDVTLESGTIKISGWTSVPGRLQVGDGSTPGQPLARLVVEGSVQLDSSAARLEVAASGELRLAQGGITAGAQAQGARVVNTGAIVFDDTSGGQGHLSSPYIEVPVTNSAGARLEVLAGRATLAGGLLQEGTVAIGQGATLVHPALFTNAGTLRSQGTLDLGGAVLSNLGTIVLEVPEGSQIPTSFEVLGTLLQSADGRIEAQIGRGSVAPLQQLSVSGAVGLAGRIDLVTDPATFRPFNGQAFDLVTSVRGIQGSLNVPLDFRGSVLPPLDGQVGRYRLTYLGPDCPVGVCWTGFAQNSDWTDGRNWSTRTRPPLAAESAYIRQPAGASVVLASTSQAVASLETDAGNDVSLTGGSLTVSGTARIGGLLRLDGASSQLVLGGAVDGAGAVRVNAGRLEVSDSSALAVAALQQTGGTIGFGGAFGRQALQGRFSRSAGTVELQGTFDNAGSTLDLGAPGLFGSGPLSLSGTITGGTLLSSDTTTLQGAGGTLAGVTLAGTLGTSGRLSFSGGLRLADGARIDAGGSTWSFAADTAVSVASGTASVRGLDATLEVASGGPGALDIGSGVTLEGGFQVSGASGSSLRNAGTLVAGTPGVTFGVKVDDFVQAGTLRTTQGDFEVALASGPFVNGGTIDLAGQTRLAVSSAMVNNGLMRGDGRIELQGAMLTNRGTLQPGDGVRSGLLGIEGSLLLEGASLLDVLLDANPGASRLSVSGNVQLGGGLKVRLSQGFQPPAGASFDVVTAGKGSTMVGAFSAGSSSLPPGLNGAIVPGSGNVSFLYRLTNSGQSCPGVCWTGGAGDSDWSKGRNWTSLNAPPGAQDAAYINLVTGAQVKVSGGAHVVASLDTASGNDLTISAGSLTVRGVARLGGALTSTGGSLMLGDGSTLARLDMSAGRLAVAGTLSLQPGAHTWSAGTWAGSGLVRLEPGATLQVGSASGTPVLDGPTLTLETGSRATASGDLLLASDTTLRNAGVLVLSSGRIGAAAGALAPPVLRLENGGSVEKSGTGDATLAHAAISGAGGVSILGGRLVLLEGAGTLGGSLSVSTGAGWELAGGSVSVQGPVTNAAGATIGLTRGARLDLDAATAFDQRGTLQIAAGSTLRRAPGLVNAATGVIMGAGTLDLAGSTLDNAGTIRPGGTGAVGTLTVQGAVVLGPSSLLEVDLQASPTATVADRLAASGPVQLGGTLSTLGTASLSPQQEVDLVSSTGALGGQFARTQLPAGAFGRIDVQGGLTVYRLAGCAGVCWDGGASTLSWGDAANWSTDRLPGAGDAVSIRMASGITVQFGGASQQVASLAVGAGSGLRIDTGSFTVAGAVDGGGAVTLSGGQLLLADTGALGVGRLVQGGGTLGLGGRFGPEALQGRLDRSAGDLVLSGNLVNGSVVLDIGSAGIFGKGGLSSLTGTVTGGTLVSGDGTALRAAGGTLDSVTIRGNLSQGGSLNLTGTTVLAPGVGASGSVFDLGAGRWTLQPGASLAVQGGGVTLRLAGGEIAGRLGGQPTSDGFARPLGSARPEGPPGTTPFILPAGLTLAGSGTLDFAQGILNQGTLQPGPGTLLVGTAQTPADLTNEGLIDLSLGTLRVSGALDLRPASQLRVTLDGSRFAVGDPALVTAGSARLDGSLSVALASSFDPQPGARFDILGSSRIGIDALTGSGNLLLPAKMAASIADGTTLRLSVSAAGAPQPVQAFLAANAPVPSLAVVLSSMRLPLPPRYAWAPPDPCLDEEARGLRATAPALGPLRDPLRERVPTEGNLAEDERARLAPPQPVLRRSAGSLTLPGSPQSDAAPVSVDLRRTQGAPAGRP
jgi:filamentous hemagglutinin family protein